MLIEHEKFELALLARGAARTAAPPEGTARLSAPMRETLEKMDAKKGWGERMKLFIDPELRWLTPPLGAEEYEQLRANVLCDPLMIWRIGRDTLLSTAQVRGAARND
jgi:hypothetical protein